MKSIMHDKKDGTCYLCMAAGDYMRKAILEEHHAIHGTANRRLSEKWGLKVYLCPAHHRRIHDSKDGRKDDLYIQRAAQDAFRERYPHEDFRQIFGKNILADDTLPSVSDTVDQSCQQAAGVEDFKLLEVEDLMDNSCCKEREQGECPFYAN
ncbi:MAG: hypothetical protein IJM23_09820 [Lachnospiraceae bacterium]|nr:hypothetical protein [Lachnospiraceae bacterium]